MTLFLVMQMEAEGKTKLLWIVKGCLCLGVQDMNDGLWSQRKILKLESGQSS
jgi:hypothetical protein